MSEIWEQEGNTRRAKELASDLQTLQIDLTLVPEIRGERMPVVRIALCQIASRYIAKLREFRMINEDQALQWQKIEPQILINAGFKKGLINKFQQQAQKESGQFPGGRDAFSRIHAAADLHLSKNRGNFDLLDKTNTLTYQSPMVAGKRHPL